MLNVKRKGTAICWNRGTVFPYLDVYIITDPGHYIRTPSEFKMEPNSGGILTVGPNVNRILSGWADDIQTAFRSL